MSRNAEIQKVLQSRKSDSDMINIMDVLDLSQDQFQLAFDLGLEMENRNLVKLIYSNFNAGKVVVEFTLLGKQ